jgi:hypothetical protein
MVRDHFVQSAQPCDPLGQACPGEPTTALGDHLHIVMGLGPVIPDEQHPNHLQVAADTPCSSPEKLDGDLMDQCSTSTRSAGIQRHDIPPAITNSSLTGRAHDLELDLTLRPGD